MYCTAFHYIISMGVYYYVLCKTCMWFVRNEKLGRTTDSSFIESDQLDPSIKNQSRQKSILNFVPEATKLWVKREGLSLPRDTKSWDFKGKILDRNFFFLLILNPWFKLIWVDKSQAWHMYTRLIVQQTAILRNKRIRTRGVGHQALNGSNWISVIYGSRIN